MRKRGGLFRFPELAQRIDRDFFRVLPAKGNLPSDQQAQSLSREPFVGVFNDPVQKDQLVPEFLVDLLRVDVRWNVSRNISLKQHTEDQRLQVEFACVPLLLNKPPDLVKLPLLLAYARFRVGQIYIVLDGLSRLKVIVPLQLYSYIARRQPEKPFRLLSARRSDQQA